jgi:LysR family hydrogen peroxide-inducible transcriptional activator
LATPLENKKIKEYPLYYEPFRVYIPSSIKIKSKEMSIEDLQNYEMIVLGEEHCFRSQALKVCKNKSYGRIEAGSFETIKKLVDNNLGLTLLPHFEEVTNKNQLRDLKDPIPAREISLVTNQSFYKMNILKAIKTEILNLIPKEFHTKKNYHIMGVE